MLAGRRAPGDDIDGRRRGRAGDRRPQLTSLSLDDRRIPRAARSGVDAARRVVADGHDRAPRRRPERLVRHGPAVDLRARRSRRGDGRRAPRGPRQGGSRPAPARRGGRRRGRPHRRVAGADRLRLVAVRDAVRPRLGRGGAGLRPAGRPGRRRPGDRGVRRGALRRSPAGVVRPGGWAPPLDRPGRHVAARLRRDRVRRASATRGRPRAGPVAHRSADQPLQPLAAVRDARAGGQPHAAQRSRLLRADDRRRRAQAHQRHRRPPARRRRAPGARRRHPHLDQERRQRLSLRRRRVRGPPARRPRSSARSSSPRRSAPGRRRSAWR